MMMAGPGMDPELEAAARRAGFKNAEQALAWQRNRARIGNGAAVTGWAGATPKPAPVPPPQQQGMFGAVWDRINQALGGAVR